MCYHVDRLTPFVLVQLSLKKKLKYVNFTNLDRKMVVRAWDLKWCVQMLSGSKYLLKWSQGN